MPDTERSITQSLFLTSNLQNVEMNVRRYWVGFSPCVSGTCLAGFRYTRLYEDFHLRYDAARHTATTTPEPRTIWPASKPVATSGSTFGKVSA